MTSVHGDSCRSSNRYDERIIWARAPPSPPFTLSPSSLTPLTLSSFSPPPSPFLSYIIVYSHPLFSSCPYTLSYHVHVLAGYACGGHVFFHSVAIYVPPLPLSSMFVLPPGMGRCINQL